MKERSYYRPLADWLRKEKGFFTGGTFDEGGKEFWFVNKGLVNRGTPGQLVDVAGVRNVGSKFQDELEVAAVEVRVGHRMKSRDLQDAMGYANLAHLCYLAHTEYPSQPYRRKASEMGLGLIHIEGRNHFREILPARKGTPVEKDYLNFLDRLSIGRCCVCNSYFFTFSYWYDSRGRRQGSTYFELDRMRQFDWEVVHFKQKMTAFEVIRTRRTEGKFRMARYICVNCVEELQNLLGAKKVV